jgi:hypothetical protein
MPKPQRFVKVRLYRAGVSRNRQGKTTKGGIKIVPVNPEVTGGRGVQRYLGKNVWDEEGNLQRLWYLPSETQAKNGFTFVVANVQKKPDVVVDAMAAGGTESGMSILEKAFGGDALSALLAQAQEKLTKGTTDKETATAQEAAPAPAEPAPASEPEAPKKRGPGRPRKTEAQSSE